jgi:hypothetical protein
MGRGNDGIYLGFWHLTESWYITDNWCGNCTGWRINLMVIECWIQVTNPNCRSSRENSTRPSCDFNPRFNTLLPLFSTEYNSHTSYQLYMKTLLNVSISKKLVWFRNIKNPGYSQLDL